MEPFQAVILGTVQGLTEFLPVSSSGHLVIFQKMFGLQEPELLFDVSVHLGTLAAVSVFFRKEILEIKNSLKRAAGVLADKEAHLSEMYADPGFKLIVFIAAGSVPTAVLGLLFNTVAGRIFSSVAIVGSMLVVTGVVLFLTGCMLWSTCVLKESGKDLSLFSIKGALIVGLVQGLAIIPGISRSGSTIAAGLFLGLNRESAARYSFLLSIPAIIGAAGLILTDAPSASSLPVGPLAIGLLTSCAVGYASLRFLMHIVNRGNLHLFAPYCWAAGILAFIFGL